MQDKAAKPTSHQRMVRQQILISPEQKRRLAAHARSMGCPESEVIRAAIDREIGVEADDLDWKRRLLSLAGSFSREEADALEDTIRKNRKRWIGRIEVIRRKLGGGD